MTPVPLKRRPGGFTFTPLKMRKTKMNSRATTLVSTSLSVERILENTPTLKALYGFLAKPMP
jgi:hypothetical protein